MNTGLIWGLLVLVILTACAGKIFGCTIAAKISGLSWRDSATVGILMNTKGLVEIIGLNLGLQAGVINSKVFVVMVGMAIVTTCMTTPIVSFIYPLKDIKDIIRKNRDHQLEGDMEGKGKGSDFKKNESFKVMVTLHNMQTVPAVMNLVSSYFFFFCLSI